MNVLNTTAVLLTLTFGLAFGAVAEETVLEKVETTTNRGVDGIKRTSRKIGEKYCETVNGKVSCTTKKIKNKLKNSSDKMKTDATEVINTVD